MDVDVLEMMMVPKWLINLIRGLYDGSSAPFVLTVIRGCLTSITSGMKQEMGGALAAFADDLGMSLKD
eukprot:592156-Heterocapsa_arctica.AAC.1